MELHFEKQELSCLAQVMRGVREQELTQEIRLSESMPDAGKVLAGWGQVILRGKEWMGSQIGAAGGVMAWVLYAPEDGSAPRTVETWIPFQMKWEGAEAEAEGPMRMLPVLRFVDGRNLSARKILIRAGISCLGEGLRPLRTEVFIPAQVPGDVQLLRRSYPLRLPREAGERTFDLEETLDPGGMPVTQILSYHLEPELTECRVTGDKAVIRGIGRLHLVCQGSDGRLCCRNLEVPFSQLAELDRTYGPDARGDVWMAVTGLEADLTEENVTVKAGLVAQYLISDRTLVELVEDAYSTRRDVGIRQEELYLPVILDETRERITAAVTMTDVELDPVDAVFWPGLPRISRRGDRTEAEMTGRFQLLGYDPEGNLRAATTAWTGQTGLAADETSRVDVLAQAAGTSQAAVGMELRGDTELQFITSSRQGLPMITGLELGAQREPDRQRPSLILCRTGSRGLWHLAKSSGSTISAIRAANELTDEPEAGKMILIPVS